MPTSARLAAALFLLLVGAVATLIVASNLPDEVPAQYLFPVNLFLAFVIGWTTIGKRVGNGIVPALNAGLTAGFLLVFWVLLFHSLGRMWTLSFRRAYKYPPEAIIGWFEEFAGYAVYLQDFSVIATLVVGSALTGVIAEIVNRQYR